MEDEFRLIFKLDDELCVVKGYYNALCGSFIHIRYFDDSDLVIYCTSEQVLEVKKSGSEYLNKLLKNYLRNGEII